MARMLFRKDCIENVFSILMGQNKIFHVKINISRCNNIRELYKFKFFTHIIISIKFKSTHYKKIFP